MPVCLLCILFTCFICKFHQSALAALRCWWQGDIIHPITAVTRASQVTPLVQAAPVRATVSAAAGEQSGQPATTMWPGAKLGPLAASVAIGLALRFAVPVPAGVTLQAWTLLAIFVSTIAGARNLNSLCVAVGGAACMSGVRRARVGNGAAQQSTSLSTCMHGRAWG